ALVRRRSHLADRQRRKEKRRTPERSRVSPEHGAAVGIDLRRQAIEIGAVNSLCFGGGQADGRGSGLLATDNFFPGRHAGIILAPVTPEEVSMLKLAFAGTVLLALVSVAAAAGSQDGKRNVSRGTPPAKTVSRASTADVRRRVIDNQQTLDRILADTTPAPVGTSGAGKTVSTDVQSTGSPPAATRQSLALP